MTDVPEILAAIGLHLDIDSLLACTTVCRQWSAVFAPCIWHNFDITRKLWRHLLDSRSLSKTGEEDNFIERQERLTALMNQHNQHIRHLTVKDKMVLIAALEAPLTGLHSLTLELEIWELDADDEESDINKSNTWISMMLAAIAEKSPLEVMVPEAAFADDSEGDQARLDWTRACWLTVLMNSALRRLTYGGYSSLRYVNSLATQPPKEQEGEGGSLGESKMPLLTSVSESFLVDTLSRLPRLRHLELGMNADNFIFHNLETLLPNLESFVHVDRAFIDTGAVQLASPHQALRILDFQQVSITASQLRAIVIAFPVLHRLSITQARSRIYDVNYDKYNTLISTTSFQIEDILEHSSLTYLSIRHQPHIDFLRSRTKFPKITGIDRSVPIKNAYELRQLLWAFPALERLDSEYELGERVPLRAEEIIHEKDREYRLRSLNINTSSFSTCDLDSCIAQMPFLVLLEISGGFLDGRVLTELARTCKNLQYARFDLQEECSQELNALFVGCSKLKECLGKGHRVRAEDIIGGPEWSCHSLEKLDMKIVGVPRLSAEQTYVLDKMDGIPKTDVEREVLELDKEMRRIQSIISHRLEPLTNYARITISVGL
ncbi:hypothetical protein BG015_006858 [Linnemannia schmuckeri]|uniref:F-box domain-containing protein n=1 Tax=Linnemannia schmuckeri TaxID=64567 RepID=A0A9P5VBU5_9FUNG|nr:hypothetical protein BG015_006858 [Linnemannia schmuckeri]